MRSLRTLAYLWALLLFPVIDVFAADLKHSAELPAFPGAVGFGSMTVGGSGRNLHPPKTRIYRVTSLEDSGNGTLRECMVAVGPRTCVFEVSGRIDLHKFIEVKNPFLTVAGQTAPNPGITITGGGFKISTNDVLIRHLAIRPGDSLTGPPAPARDAITVSGNTGPTFNVVLDHLSLTWALDENFSTYGDKVSDVTISNSIIAEGLHHSIHPDGPHSKGILIGDDTKRISVHGCLLAHNQDRNPRQKPGSSLEFVNNVIYNWGGMGNGHQANPSDTTGTNKPTFLTFAGNYYKPGPDSPKRAAIYVSPDSPGLKIFVQHNFGPTRTTDTADEWDIADAPKENRVMSSPLPFSKVIVHRAEETYKFVLEQAGVTQKSRNPIDLRIIDEVKRGQGSIKDCIGNCSNSAGGWPSLAENKHKLDLPAHPNKDSNGNGYTDLEDWLNSAATKSEK